MMNTYRFVGGSADGCTFGPDNMHRDGPIEMWWQGTDQSKPASRYRGVKNGPGEVVMEVVNAVNS